MNQATDEPFASFSKTSSGPCVRFVLEGGKHLVLPYIHATSFEYEDGLLACSFPGLAVQIEGTNLLPLLLELQQFAVEFVRSGRFASEDRPQISRVVVIRVRDEADIAPQ